MEEKTKRKPCERERAIPGGQAQVFRPSVTCAELCDGCGWNPEEMKRRYRDGRFAGASSRLNYLNGEREKLPDGTVRLIFPRWCESGN